MEAGEFRKRMEQAAADGGWVQEIRIRAGKPIMLWIDGEERWLLESGGLWKADEKRMEPGSQAAAGRRTPGSRAVCAEAVIADRELIRSLTEAFTRHSMYAFDEEIRQGYLTIEGGHRVGIAGKAVPEGEKVKRIKDISGLNIRISHELPGCADRLLPWLYARGELLNTLLVSPPGGGKTTLLRELIRQASDGNRYGRGVSVSVVDERSEIGACFRGVPQCDLGLRTDVLDGCPKAQGMLMMIRSMAPGLLAVDEIGTREDMEALEAAASCGCRILATAHGNSTKDLENHPVLGRLIREKRFERYVVLSRRPRPGTFLGVYDERLAEIEGAKAVCGGS